MPILSIVAFFAALFSLSAMLCVPDTRKKTDCMTLEEFLDIDVQNRAAQTATITTSDRGVQCGGDDGEWTLLDQTRCNIYNIDTPSSSD